MIPRSGAPTGGLFNDQNLITHDLGQSAQAGLWLVWWYRGAPSSRTSARADREQQVMQVCDRETWITGMPEYVQQRFTATLFAMFSVLAILLAGVMVLLIVAACTATQRRWRVFRNTHSPVGVELHRMPSVKCRWLLPVGHALIDCALLLLYLHGLARPPQSLQGRRQATPSALLLQESVGVTFDLRTLEPPGDFLLIQAGNLPVGLISSIRHSQPWLVNGVRGWDPTWFMTHEVLALLSWFLIGIWIDCGHPRMRALMLAYLLLRCLIPIFGIYDVGWRMQEVFWMCLVFWLCVRGFVQLLLVTYKAARRGRTV